MKVGDRLYCHRADSSRITVGKSYIVKQNINGYNTITMSCYYIVDNFNQMDYYSINKDNVWYYGRWFISEQEIRKMKLEKLNAL